MEFFEKAHIAKTGKVPTRKNNKSEEKTKKKLKQMLYGYKHSDNKIIRDSELSQIDLEDSSSVSGVSDLELSNSGSDGNESQDVAITDPNECSLSDTKDISTQDISSSSSDEDDNVTRDRENLSQNAESQTSEEKHSDTESTESISEYDEDIVSLSDDLDDKELGDDSTLDSFILDPAAESADVDSDSDLETFDPNGELANKILEKLDGSVGKKKKSKKRKIEDVNLEDETKATKLKNKTKKLKDVHVYKGPFRPKDDDSIEVELQQLGTDLSNINIPDDKESTDSHSDEEFFLGDTDSDKNINQENSSQDVSDNSEDQSPFVSVLAANMPGETLSDILGEYCHPTIRNLPSESQNAYSTNNSGLFTTEDVNISDMTMEDEVGSLIPEIDNETVDDIDLPTDLDTSSHIPNEESTLYDISQQSENLSERELSTDSLDPSLVNPVKVYTGKNGCIFVIKHPNEIFLHGKVKVRCLGGTVEILGHTLQEGTYEVYAPNHNYAHYIRTIETPTQNAYHGLFGKLTSNGLKVVEAEEIVTTLGEYDAVINLQPLKKRKIDFIQNNFNVTDLFGKVNKNVDNYFKSASDTLGCSLYLSKPFKSFEELVSWKHVINYGLENQSRGIVCGGKSAGKSTFLRYYVNNVLAQTSVLVIDLDPGQCEFTVAGNVSATVVSEPLLGPNFTHLKTPEIILHIGMINTMDNPRRYANAVEALITHCYSDERLRNMPWIVNTMGMTNAMGLKYMSLIILQLKPTFLLQIDSKNPKKKYDFHLYPQTVRNLYFEDYMNDSLFKNVNDANVDYKFFISHHTENTVKNNFSLAPRDERYLNFLAYFGELLGSNNTSGELLGVVPYEVDIKDLRIVLNVRIGDDAISSVLNGKVVALCKKDGRPGVFTLGDEPLQCFGSGLIRGVDFEKGKAYVLTPARDLAAVTALVYCDWAPELRCECNLPAGTPLPYRTASQYDQRQLMFAPKRRFNPIQLLKMSRSG